MIAVRGLWSEDQDVILPRPVLLGPSNWTKDG